MKHKFTYRDTFQVPKVNLCWNFSPSWWEGLAVIVFYFGQKIGSMSLCSFLFYIYF